MDIKERLQRSEASIKEITSKLQKSKKNIAKANLSEAGYVEVCVEAEEIPMATQYDVDYVNMRLGWLQDDLNYFRQTFYDHLQGHLPKIVGATAMEKALKALGLDGDYQVAKQTIYANDGKATSEEFLISRTL